MHHPKTCPLSLTYLSKHIYIKEPSKPGDRLVEVCNELLR